MWITGKIPVNVIFSQLSAAPFHNTLRLPFLIELKKNIGISLNTLKYKNIGANLHIGP